MRRIAGIPTLLRLTTGAASFVGLGFLLLQGTALLGLVTLVLAAGFVLAARFDGHALLDRSAIRRRLLPFCWGLVLPLMRQFHWDGVDWQTRINWLLAALALVYWLRYARSARLLSRGLRLFGNLSLAKRLLTVFLLSYASFLAAIIVFELKGVKLGGDEPHYLVIAQSLARDGDLNVANQYFEGQYRAYLDIDALGIHGHQGKKGIQEIYSMHLPGVAFSFVPLLWLIPSGDIVVPAIRLLLGAYASLLFMLIYLCLWRLTGERRFPLLVTLIMAWSTPMFFHSMHIYPEVQVALLTLGALYFRFLSPLRDESRAFLLSGLLLGLLPFFGVKYALLLYLYGIGIGYALLRKRLWLNALLFALGPLAMQGLFFLYLYHAYGNFSPASVYFNSLQKSQFLSVLFDDITLKMRVEAFLNYFLDQRDGLLLYAPLYLFALAGFFTLIRRVRRDWKLLWIILPPLAYIGSYAAQTHRGGFCPQARPLAPVIWMLMLLVLYWYRHSRQRWMKRILLPGLVGYGFFITVLQLFNPLTLYQPTTSDVLFRPGLLFQRMSNGLLDLPGLLPSFIKTEGNFSWLPNIVFILLLLMLTTLALLRRRSRSPLVLPRAWILPWVLIFVLFPRIPIYNPVLIVRADIVPHRLYGASHYPRQAENRYFRIGAQERFPILMAPLFPVESLHVRLRNMGSDAVSIKLWNFDTAVFEQELPAETERIVAIPEYTHRSWQGMNLIQLYLASRGEKPDLEIEVLPRSRRSASF